MLNPRNCSLQEILAALDRGATVITGNNRLAASLRQAYEQTLLNKGLEYWPTPGILPWMTWLQRNWETVLVTGAGSGLLLNSHQEQYLWDSVINEATVNRPPQQPAGTVRQAQEAWRLLHAWRLPLDSQRFDYNDDSRVFCQWAEAFRTRCQESRWLTSATLPGVLEHTVRSGAMDLPAELLLTGFDELTPQQQSLLQACQAAGSRVQWLQTNGRRGEAWRLSCTDQRGEAAAAARWARQRLEADPAVMLGIVVPDLAAMRDGICHALDEVLAPATILPDSHKTTRPYNVSLGLPLSRYPLINTALRLLQLMQRECPQEDITRLLCSPFLAGWNEEAGSRALLDSRLRESGELAVAWNTVLYHAGQTDRPYACPRLAERFRAALALRSDQPRKGSPGRWSEWLANLLQTAGWAAGRPLDSAEYQARMAWQELLGAFAALEPIAGTLTAGDAIRLLKRMAQEHIFQPQTGMAPVQVLGLLEASGMQFDHLWIMGLHDGIWPAAPRPNPFLPLPLQRATGMPRTSEARELQVARIMTERLLASADSVFVSYPLRDGDETLRPSPLISGLPAADPESAGLWQGPVWRDLIHRLGGLTALAADPAPALEHAETAGGSSLFKLQAACPFRAFAELRLGASPLGRPAIGLDPMTRGSLLHRVLETLWQALESHAGLQAMENGQLQALTDDRVQAAIEEVAGRYPRTFTGVFREIEAERLRRQVMAWLEIERQRAPFRVESLETTHQASAGDIRVRVKVDRIDTLEDGRKVLIDYKTGRVKPAQWFGERPEEPQLPLYSIAVADEIAAVLFAQVRAGDMAFNGVADSDGVAPGVKPYTRLAQTRAATTWQAVLQEWRRTIERLGQAFARGEATVDPKNYPQTCRFCNLTPLCRINEMTTLDRETAAEETPDD